MTSCPSMTTVAFCSVSSTRGRWNTPLARRASSSFFKYACSLSMLSLFQEFLWVATFWGRKGKCGDIPLPGRDCAPAPHLLKGHDYFAAVAGFHDFHGVVNALKRQGMGDYLFEIELAGFEDTAGAIPGIQDVSACDAHDGDTPGSDIRGQDQH